MGKLSPGSGAGQGGAGRGPVKVGQQFPGLAQPGNPAVGSASPGLS